MAMLDEIHPKLGQPATDPNSYSQGNNSGHNIVIACLPSGIYGTTSATTVVSHLRTTFPAVQYGLLVGLGGGVPNVQNNDIRLGDVVVSKPVDTYPGVIQYDFGRIRGMGEFQPVGMLFPPPTTFLTAIAHIQASEMKTNSRCLIEIARDVLEGNPNMVARFSRPLGASRDRLFEPSYQHVSDHGTEGGDPCAGCIVQHEIIRARRTIDDPTIHYGTIASGNQLMRDSQLRDLIAQESNVLCFEMEAAGIMDQLPSVVIRGICDYSDSHKNKEWQGYATLNAAAFAKHLLLHLPLGRPPALDNKSTGAAQCVVPFVRNAQFTGREQQIREIEDKGVLSDRVAIFGLGGVGKTQVALELVY
ncbi:nucleoside phosphorylase domain-containing protein [Aspergillus heterothallicus]